MTEKNKDPFREAREKIKRQQEARAQSAEEKARKEEMDRRLAAARAKARAEHEKQMAKAAAQEEVSLPAEYTVQPGDTLSAIALKFYGNAALWQEIYKANKKVIGKDPGLIKVGQVLTIPKLD